MLGGELISAEMVKKIGLPLEHCWVVLLGGLVWRVSKACAVVFMNVVLGANIGLMRVFTFLVPCMDVLSSRGFGVDR